SSTLTQHTIFYHYSATLVPFVSIAAVYGFAFLIKKFPSWFYHLILGFSLLIAVVSFIKYEPLIKNRIDLCFDHRNGIRQEFVDKVPSDAGVVASFVF